MSNQPLIDSVLATAVSGDRIAGLVAAAAENALGHTAQSLDNAQKATHLLATLQQKWDADNYKSYLSRPDIQDRRAQLAKLAGTRSAGILSNRKIGVLGMQRQQIGRIAGTVLALLMAAVASIWAQSGDTPIIILDGSLTMTASRVGWDRFTGKGDVRTHPQTGKSVTGVEIAMPGKNQTVSFKNQACIVDITYAGEHIKFTTGLNGSGLSFSPFTSFVNGHGSAPLSHKNPNAKISHVTVIKAGTQAFDSAASGGTKITIHYQ